MNEPTVNFSIRNLRADLRDRLRLIAALSRSTLEAVANDALARGIAEIERERIAARRAKRPKPHGDAS